MKAPVSHHQHQPASDIASVSSPPSPLSATTWGATLGVLHNEGLTRAILRTPFFAVSRTALLRSCNNGHKPAPGLRSFHIPEHEIPSEEGSWTIVRPVAGPPVAHGICASLPSLLRDTGQERGTDNTALWWGFVSGAD